MPLNSALHVDKLLSNVSLLYRNENYIAMEIFPEVPVKMNSDLYRVYVRNFRIPETARATGGVSFESDFDVTNNSYTLEWHALKGYVPDRMAENYDIADLRADTTRDLSDKLLRRLEKKVCDLMTKTSWSLTVSLAAGGEWSSNTTTTNPIPTVDTGTTTVIANSGKKPTYGVMGRAGFVAVKNHVSVLDRTKYVTKEMDATIIASLFGLDKLHVADMNYDSSELGATESLSSIWDAENMFLGWKPASAGPLAPSAGYIFRNNRPMVKRWRVEERESDAIEVNMEFNAKVVASLCGYLICNVI